MPDPWQFFTAARIAAAAGAPEAAVRAHWPLVVEALDAQGINDRPTQIAAIATIAIETASRFAPIHEFRNADGSIPAIWNTYDGGPEFHGRGLIQITHRSNYQKYGDMLGVDLVGNPDLALDPGIAAQILALYFANHGGGPLIPQAARLGDWREVRRLVQGGSAGLDRMLAITSALGGEMPKVTYNRDEPAIAQDDDWSCAPTSLRWALTALGRKPGPTYIENLLLKDGLVTKEAGLLDASGAQLAAWIGKPGTAYYGEDGFYGQNEASISFEWAAHEGAPPSGAGHAYPVLIGGRAWNHWSALRDYDPQRQVLLLANPADGWKGVSQTMSRQQFAALGPFSAVRVLHPDLLGVAPAPPPLPVPPPKLTPAEIKAALIEMVAPSDQEIVGRVLREKIAALADRI